MGVAAGSGWLLAGSLVLCVAERGAECAVLVHYFLTGQILWAGWTLGLLLPGCVIQALSFAWLQEDGHPRCFTLGLVHIFQLGIFKRHVDCLRLALCGGREEPCQEQELVIKQGDLSLLRLMEALLQALPQLLLQTYVYMTLEGANVYVACCALACLLSLSWALVSFSHFLCLLRPGHLCLPWASVLCQLLWRMGMIGTRVMALVVFARAYHFWVFAVGGAHWLVMSFWLVAQQTDVIARPCYWRLFNVLLGAVYVFCFINVRDGPSRYRVAIFYVIMLLENCILLLLATDFLQGAVWSNVKLSVAVLSGFLIGCAALIIYYTLLHPKSTEISQSFKKIGKSHGKPEESVLSSRWWSRTAKKEANDLLGGEDLSPKTGNQEAVAASEDLAWMKAADKQHHLLLLKLAMKTGNLSKINAAFGDGGFGDLFSLGYAQNPEQPLFQNNVQDDQKNLESPTSCSSKFKQLVMRPGQMDVGQDCKYVPHEGSTYVSLGNSKTCEHVAPKDVRNKAHEGRSSGKASESNARGCSTNGGLGSPTLYFSAHADEVLPGKDSHCVDIPEGVLKLHTDSPLKEEPETETVTIPVICVSPILSLATNSNFQRSIGDDTSSLCEESDVSHDDSGITETEAHLVNQRFHLLASGIPSSVKGRLVQEEKPCFTSTPKPQATNVESEMREATKAKRRLDPTD
ncbi:XK-related protein 5 [Hyperolius riggenbachi]|uniref:XK-related protein 5 n=1 Tax=Hyperolius riggenbachi TaxID=752182 RepID=UPI0035A2C157